MTEATLTMETPARGFGERLLGVLLHPRQELAAILSEERRSWRGPLVLRTATAVALVLIAAALLPPAPPALPISDPSIPGPIYTPEQMAQIEQALAALSGPVFVYVFPAALAVLGTWVGWLLLSVALHVLFTWLGSPTTGHRTSNLAAWALVPFIARDLVRIAWTVFARQPILQPGLSGFASSSAEGGLLYLGLALAFIDLYFFWQLLLIFVGARTGAEISRPRLMVGLLLLGATQLALLALPSYLLASLSSLSLVRPFFYY